MTERTVKKLRAATTSSGRGMDNTQTPARYGVYEGERLVLTISADSTRQYERAEWDVCEGDKRLKTFDTFAKAKAWALRARPLSMDASASACAGWGCVDGCGDCMACGEAGHDIQACGAIKALLFAEEV